MIANDQEIVWNDGHSTIMRDAFVAEMRRAIRAARAPRMRTYREFAEQELIIPEGKYEDEKFRSTTQPYSGPLLDAYDSGKWNRFAVTGCVQSGKTLTALVIPVLYHLFETKEKVILAAPNMVTCQEKWSRELLPVIEKNPKFSKYLPTKGKGSRKGQADEIEFTNGAVLKFMTAGGGDETRSHYTARVVVITEADKMDEAGESSREADPCTQIEARTESFAEDKRVFIECTVSVETGRIWQEKTNGTDTELYVKCVACQHPFSPQREHLKGWKEATNEIDARDSAYFECPSCKVCIDDKMRAEMVAGKFLVHRGQEIVDGVVMGEEPKTLTFGYRWNAFFNSLWSIGHMAMSEWKANRAKEMDSEDYEDLEKKQLQWYWATPWVPEDFNDFELTATQVRSRTAEWFEGILPADTAQLTMGIDIGKHTCWWFLVAFRSTGELHVPEYGALTVPDTKSDEAAELAVLQTLRDFRDQQIEKGWQIDGTDQFLVPQQVWIDQGYLTDAVCRFVNESGRLRRNRYRPVAGRGRSMIKVSPYSHPKIKDSVTREIGNNWYAQINRERKVVQGFFNADYWKLWLQRRLVTKPGAPGSMTLWQPRSKFNDHGRLSRHLTNERFVRYEKPGKGLVEEWEKKGQNHWLDAAAMACAAGDKAGYRLVSFDALESPTYEEVTKAIG